MDRELWRVTKDLRVIRCVLRVVQTIGLPAHQRTDPMGAELRLAHNGQVYLRELHQGGEEVVAARSRNLRRDLENQGWALSG